MTAGESSAAASAAWEALFVQYGVDFYVAGHFHLYESLWPSVGGVPTQKNFTRPLAPIHVTAGNGGAPGPDHFSQVGRVVEAGAVLFTMFVVNWIVIIVLGISTALLFSIVYRVA